MPVRRTCSFCGNDIEPGTGKMYIRKDGTVYLFCSSKCQRNLLQLGRIPRWTPWTQAFRRASAVAAAGAPEVVLEEAPPAVADVPVDVAIEAPKGRDIPADLRDLIDKKIGPDLSRGDIEKYFADFLSSGPFRHSIVGWARKAHAGKAISRIEKAEFLAYKDSPEGRRVFKSWLDDQWAKAKGRRKEVDQEGEEEAPRAAPAKRKKGA